MVRVSQLGCGSQNIGIGGLHLVALNVILRTVVVALIMVISMNLKDLVKLQNMHTIIMEMYTRNEHILPRP